MQGFTKHFGMGGYFRRFNRYLGLTNCKAFRLPYGVPAVTPG